MARVSFPPHPDRPDALGSSLVEATITDVVLSRDDDSTRVDVTAAEGTASLIVSGDVLDLGWLPDRIPYALDDEIPTDPGGGTVRDDGTVLHVELERRAEGGLTSARISGRIETVIIEAVDDAHRIEIRADGLDGVALVVDAVGDSSPTVARLLRSGGTWSVEAGSVAPQRTGD